LRRPIRIPIATPSTEAITKPGTSTLSVCRNAVSNRSRGSRMAFTNSTTMSEIGAKNNGLVRRPTSSQTLINRTKVMPVVR
jgi:hypothetical protein